MDESAIALVTGANKGIGFATARRFAERGWTVLLGARDRERGELAVAELSGDVRVLALDVTADESVSAAAEEVQARCGRLDVLVNNAGIGGGFLSALEAGPTEVRAPSR